MTKDNILELAKHMNIQQNVCIRVIDQKTGQIVQEHIGHNSATNSLLYGIAYHLIGDFMPNERHGLNPGYSMLSNYVPRYISLGTMGLINQDQDAAGLPAGIGDTIPSSTDPKYLELLQALNDAKSALDSAEEALADECPYWPATTACESCQVCSDRIEAKKQARDDAQAAYDEAYQDFIDYTDEARCVEYMTHAPSYGADGYSNSLNNHRKYMGLGYAWTSYDVTESYKAESSNHDADYVTYKGILYKCINDTAIPSGVFDDACWEQCPDEDQPSIGTTVNMELISPSFPRMEITYRDVVPEYAAELPKTIDVVYSAMISTGALAQFRPEGQDYLFITEAGLWSKRTWVDGNENGLLAGYRIGPPNEKNWDMTDAGNRHILKENILKVGANQVVQVVWKIQLGSVDQFILSAKGSDPTFSDSVYYTIGSAYSNNLNRLLVEKIPSTSSNVPVSFLKSDVKRGCPVSGSTFSTDISIDGPLYLDFVVNDDSTETIYWWTATGQVHYYDNFVLHMFDNMNVIAREIDDWHYIESSVYLTDLSISILEDLVDARNYEIFAPLFTENQLPSGTVLPTSNTRGLLRAAASTTTPLYYYNEYDELNRFDYDLETFIASHSSIIPTSSDEYYVYIQDSSEGYYYCPANLEFYDNTNFMNINSVLCWKEPEPDTDSDTEHDTDSEPHPREIHHISYRGWNSHRLTNLSHAFDGCIHTNTIDLSGWDTSNVTDMSFMFNGTEHIDFLIGVDAFNTSNVVYMDYMFCKCGESNYEGYLYNQHAVYCGISDVDTDSDTETPNYEVLDISNWDTHNLTSMDYMFASSGLQIPYRYFDTSNVTSMSHTLERVRYVQYDVDAGEDITGAKLSWDTSKVTDMSHMFFDVQDCRFDLSRMNTSSVTNMSWMFFSVENSINFSTIKRFDVRNVTNFQDMFGGVDGSRTSAPTSDPHAYEWIDVSNWVTSSATNMDSMFYSCAAFIIGVENFDTSHVTNFSSMFHGAYVPSPLSAQNVDEYDLIHIDLGDWDVSSGSDFRSMFEDTHSPDLRNPRYWYTFENVDNWEVTSNAESISFMFEYAVLPYNSSNPITLDLSGWDLSGIGGFYRMFAYLSGADDVDTDSDFEPTDIQCTIILPNTITWDTSYNDDMFKDAEVQKLVWNNVRISSNNYLNYVGKLLNGNKFTEIVARNWDVRGVTNLSNFFYFRYLRKIDLYGWNISTVTDFYNMICKWRYPAYSYNQYYEPGVLDFSSMDDWTINANANVNNMCAGNLCDDEDIAQIYGYHAFEQTYTFPNWSGSWKQTGLQSTVVTATNFPYYYNQAGESYTAYYFGTYMTDGTAVDPTSTNARFTNYPSRSSDFGTYSKLAGDFVYIPTSSMSALSDAATGYFLHLEEENGELVYYNPYIDTSSDRYEYDGTLTSFKASATQIPTNNASYPLYYHDGLYYCDAPLGFSGDTNFSNVKNALVSDCTNISFRSWDAVNITSMNGLFNGCSNVEYLNLDMQHTQNVRNVANIFNGCTSLQRITGLDSWNTSKIYNYDGAFANVPNIIDMDISSWLDATSVSIDYMFQNGEVGNIPRSFRSSNWDTSNVTSMRYTCDNISNELGYPIQLNWDMGNVEDASYMFRGTSKDDFELNYLSLSDVQKVDGIFSEIDDMYSLSSDPYNATSASEMFKNSKFDEYTFFYSSPTITFNNVDDISSMFEGFTFDADMDPIHLYITLDEYGYCTTANMFKNASVNGLYSDHDTFNVMLTLSSDSGKSLTDISHMFHVDPELTCPWIMFPSKDNEHTSTGYSIDFPIDTDHYLTADHLFTNFEVCPISQYGTNLAGLDLSWCNDFSYMFANTKGWCNQPAYARTFTNIGGMVVDSTSIHDSTSMSHMFDGASGLQMPMDLSNWVVSDYWGSSDYYSVTNVEYMFHNFAAGSEYVFDYMDSDEHIHWKTGYSVLRDDQHPDTTYLKLPSFNYRLLTNYEHALDGCEVPKLVMNDVYVDSVETLNKIKAFAANNKVYYLEARNWTFDSSIKSLSRFFADWENLAIIDLTGWDVSHIEDFSYMFHRTEVADTTGYYPGIIDYSSLDNWDISSGTNFTEMFSSNLHGAYFDGSSITDGFPMDWYDEYSFTNTYRFPNWPGYFDTTGLRYDSDTGYYSFSDDYLYCHPTAGSGFGTYSTTPPPSDYLYDWDFTTSLVDSVQSEPLYFTDYDNNDTTQAPTGQWVSGTGILMHVEYAKMLRIPVNMIEPGYTLEIDFTDATFYGGSFGGAFVRSSYAPNNSGTVDWLYDDEIYEWVFCSSYEYDITQPFVSDYCDTGITNASEFANSTLKVVSEETQNGYVVWKLYNNDTLLFTSPEMMDSQDPHSFLPPPSLSSGWQWVFSPYLCDNVIITGMRIKYDAPPL